VGLGVEVGVVRDWILVSGSLEMGFGFSLGASDILGVSVILWLSIALGLRAVVG